MVRLVPAKSQFLRRIIDSFVVCYTLSQASSAVCERKLNAFFTVARSHYSRVTVATPQVCAGSSPDCEGTRIGNDDRIAASGLIL